MCVAVSIVVVLGLTAGPSATAGKRSVRDARADAPAKIDITRATYINGPRKFRARVHVRNLQHAGALRFQVTKYATDEGFAALVRYRNGRAQARLVHTYVDHDEPARCKVTASWKPRRDRVRVMFPRRCLSRTFRRDQRNYIGAVMLLGNWRKYDFAPYRHVRHGARRTSADVPASVGPDAARRHCVFFPAAYRKAKIGLTRKQIARRMHTKGRPAPRWRKTSFPPASVPRGVKVRSYPLCNTPKYARMFVAYKHRRSVARWPNFA